MSEHVKSMKDLELLVFGEVDKENDMIIVSDSKISGEFNPVIFEHCIKTRSILDEMERV